MQIFFGLAMLALGAMILIYGRPSVGGRLSAIIERPGVAHTVAVAMTALLGLGAALTFGGLAALAQ